MKIIFLILLQLIAVFCISQQSVDISLPEPTKTGGKPFMEVLNERQSLRNFSSEDFSLQQISDILWAAFGVNRADSQKRTAPSAMNAQEIEIYVVTKECAYLYLPGQNILKHIISGDYRKDMGRQSFVGDAPIVLVYVADYSKMAMIMDKKRKDFYSATDAGFISQNVYLYAASENLATVVVGLINKSKISKVLELKKNQKVILSQPIGFVTN